MIDTKSGIVCMQFHRVTPERRGCVLLLAEESKKGDAWAVGSCGLWAAARRTHNQRPVSRRAQVPLSSSKSSWAAFAVAVHKVNAVNI